MKIRLTENQFKQIIENVVKEKQNDFYNDQRAIALLTFLNKNTDGDYGVFNIKNKYDYDIYGMTAYEFDDDSEYVIGTEEEANKTAFDIAKDMIYDDPLSYLDNKTIINSSSVLNHNKISNDILDLLRNEKPEKGELVGPYIFDKLIDNFDEIIKKMIGSEERKYFISPGVEKEFKYDNYLIYKIE